MFSLLLATALTMRAQQRTTLYDEWFHAASCALHREVKGDSAVYCLAVTLDEGDISVPKGSRLYLRLRGGITVELTSDRDVTRRDVTRRRFVGRTDSYITCHFPITEDQLLQLHEHDLMQLRLETEQGWIQRRATRHLRLR
ncbi:MAG: hypothetical protein J5565_06645 [Muribaculaceae bacterium]|nr:hypothetical protein [Muribaculaceae bacterium]